MVDLATISTVLTSLNAAADIAKALRQAGLSLEEAETKARIADLVSSLADAKMSMADVQNTLLDKDREIQELKNALAISGSFKREGEAYFELDDEGAPSGDPCCPRCWEVDRRIVHLVRAQQARWKTCPGCKGTYEAHMVRLPG